MLASLLLCASLAASEPEARLSYRRSLVWTASPSLVDLYVTGWAKQQGAIEWNRLVSSPEQIVALKVAGAALAAYLFVKLEQRHGWGWRVPRYFWFAGHLFVAYKTWQAGREAGR